KYFTGSKDWRSYYS
nr:Chain c, ARG-SER-TYR-TYR-SER [synthetic construct]8BZL_d Chain d, ARG-SER-TYR-TYR-SER [synthetic construct]8BZL_e Chain e, ARG-SER-TYR-TYR-SER [synthetic construct]8BZL_f Chain f, ARG-SER-TYR-TYR-SER [synthetic construct]8BZL_g Chain g, ARG-SER-TYR-TYR-SER [synthetic construct]8BZL_h Chain h, ARG-SER-TYR-TYR-SER [synthetic construct]